ncbi:hypothetical protein BGZ83_009406 [Gryganskiella cystojenkinii]|nr:hypothetical protein BGZ83_009406 [Gryganskiella cystojenkinii]
MLRLAVINNTTAFRRTLVQPSTLRIAIASTRSYSEAFKRKEKAQEEVYYRQKEQEEIKKLRESLAKAEKEAAELKKKLGK